MSKEKKIITIISGLLMLLSFSLLFWYVYSSRNINYISSISYSINPSDWETTDEFMYYWSDTKEINENNFEVIAWEKNKPIHLIYHEPNINPQTIYLHTKKVEQEGYVLDSIPFKNYINKLLTIIPNDKQVLTKNDSEYELKIISNGFTEIDSIIVQLSENALLTGMPSNQLKYRYLEIFNGKESHKYTLNLNLQNYNVIDGSYFLKISVRDSSGKITEIYSRKIDIDFGVISRLIQFDSPVIGNNGQIILKSDIQLTGNVLVKTEFLNVKEVNDIRQSESYLTLTKDNIEVGKLNVRKFNGEKVDFIALIQLEDKKQYLLETSIKTPSDWYLLYYEDSFIGTFLYQSSRGD